MRFHHMIKRMKGLLPRLRPRRRGRNERENVRDHGRERGDRLGDGRHPGSGRSAGDRRGARSGALQSGAGRAEEEDGKRGYRFRGGGPGVSAGGEGPGAPAFRDAPSCRRSDQQRRCVHLHLPGVTGRDRASIRGQPPCRVPAHAGAVSPARRFRRGARHWRELRFSLRREEFAGTMWGCAADTSASRRTINRSWRS